MNYHHQVSGFFTFREQAESVIYDLIAMGLPRERVHFFDKYAVLSTNIVNNGSDIVLKDASIRDAISIGQMVVVVETISVKETATAEKIIQAVLGDCYDVI